MKNVFMLKADRLSNLLLCVKSFAYNVGTDWEDSEEQGNISLGAGEYANKEFYEPQEIYITSEDPIKEGDWCLYNKNHNSEKPCWEIIKCGKIENEDMHAQSDGKLILWMKNVIVTTNPVLIADLVQAVKKNFIMYFIANKGLDFIEVTDLKEVTEEAAVEKAAMEHLAFWRSRNNTHLNNPIHAERCKNDYKSGVVWQKTRSYTYEEMKESFSKGHDSARLKGSYKSNESFEEDWESWSNQFKKE